MKKNDRSYYKSLGDQLREARESKHLSLQNLSDGIGGIKSKQTLMRYEKGESRIPNDEFEIICNYLGLDSKEVDTNAKRAALVSSLEQNSVDYMIQTEVGEIFAEQLIRNYCKADDTTKEIVKRLLQIHE